MKLRHAYLLLTVIGTLLPGSQLVLFALHSGLDLPLFVREAFANRAATTVMLDVLVSSVVLWVFVITDGRMAGLRHLWLPIVVNVLIGVSAGLPLYLYMRESHLEETLRAH